MRAKLPKLGSMGWLAFGAAYSILYALLGAYLRHYSSILPWFRIIALLVPPLTGVGVIVRRRNAWIGCQWLFWASIAVGLLMSAIGVVGWSVDELLLGTTTSWLGWHAVFALFGGVAPLLALLAHPHRGVRDKATATTAVDIAGIAVLTGFLYSHFVVVSDAAGSTSTSGSLLLLSELQQFIVFLGMCVATLRATDPRWRQTYLRLAVGLGISFITLTLSNVEIWQGFYENASLGDVMWILPFMFFPWAAGEAPASNPSPFESNDGQSAAAPSRPWIIFSGLALLPLIDYGLRRASPPGPLDTFQDLSTAVAIVSVLPLLMARLAVEKAELRQVDTKLRLMGAAVEETSELIVIASADCRVRHANRAFCTAMSYTLAELIDLPPEVLLASESLSKIDDIKKIGRGESWSGALVRRRQDGSMFQAACTVVPLVTEGQITHFVCMERDITEELRIRGQLIHSERLSAVGQLVSGVAHELNNPLQSILGFTELLIEAEERPELRRDLEQVRSEAIRAGKIVRNLLAFVRRSSTERAASNINDIVKTTLALRSYEFGTSNIRLFESYADPLPAVVINPEEIQQVILNLIMNAEQAMRAAHHGGSLTVTTKPVGEQVVVEIRDNGPGVPPALAGRVFEPFFSTKEVGEGTGLGLSIAMGIAEAHGGSLTLMPTDVGACFRLSLPAASPVDQMPALVASLTRR